jgi:hypothetical protein
MENLFHKIKLVYHRRNAEVVYVKNIGASSIANGFIFVREICFLQKRYSAAQKIISKNYSVKSTVDDIYGRVVKSELNLDYIILPLLNQVWSF